MSEYCNCACWKDKELNLICYRCHGKVYYTKIVKVHEEDENIIKLAKLKKELIDKQEDVLLLRTEIRNLQWDIKELEKGSSDSSDSSDSSHTIHTVETSD